MIELDQDEAAYSVAVIEFAVRPGETFVVVDSASAMVLNPRSCNQGYLHTYRRIDDEVGIVRLEFIHKTSVDDVPGAICKFQCRLLVSVGRTIRIYDMGKKKLLRKCENETVPNFITNITTVGNRILVHDIEESFHYFRYKPKENVLVVFADDVNSRWLTTGCTLDYDTHAGTDKLGNIFVVRLAEDLKDDVKEDPTGVKALWDRCLQNGASQKVETICNYHIGETILSLQKATLIPGGSESLVYTTLSGGIGMLVAITSCEDIDFFQHLEMHTRQEYAPHCRRDHLWYRSCYFPVRNVIDGDLCEQFNLMEYGNRKNISEKLDRSPAEVSKKLETRWSVLGCFSISD